MHHTSLAVRRLLLLTLVAIGVHGGQGSAAQQDPDSLVRTWGLIGFNWDLRPDDVIVQVKAGALGTAVLTEDGKLLTWGMMVPEGNAADPSNPIVEIDYQDFHLIARRQDGSVICWGRSNDYGETTVPTLSRPAVTIGAGSRFSVAVLDDGSIECWGRNDEGQCDVPAGLENSSNPVVAIACGLGFTVALLQDGTVDGWGTFVSSEFFVPEDLEQPGNPVVHIETGEQHAIAVREDGSIACWGTNENGRCTVPADVGTPANPVRLAVGTRWATIAVLEDGTARGWGTDWYLPSQLGQPGNPVVELTGSDTHVISLTADGTLECMLQNSEGWSAGQEDMTRSTAGTKGNPIRQLAVSDRHAVALLEDGTVSCRGIQFLATPPPGLGTSPVRQVAACPSHSVAVLEDGSVVCWGYDYSGELSVPPGIGGPGNPVRMVSAGGRSRFQGFTAAVLEDGRFAGWGHGLEGQLTPPTGIGDPGQRLVEVACGLDWTLGLLEDGTVRVWGSWTTVPIGLGTPENPVTRIAAGWAHALALQLDGTVTAWGDNDLGQLEIPADVGTPENPAVDIAAGAKNSGLILEDGRAVFWGLNSGRYATPAELEDGSRPVRSIVSGYGNMGALLEPPCLAGEVITVTTEDDPRFALAVANDGCVIEFEPGVHVIDAPLDTRGRSVTLRGAVDADGNPTTVLDGRGLTRLIECTSGETDGTVIQNLRLTGGSAENGGALLLDGAAPLIENCVFVGNRATTGGAIAALNGSAPLLYESLVSGNRASSGGGIYHDATSASELSGTLVCNNDSDQVVGIWYDDANNCISDRCSDCNSCIIQVPLSDDVGFALDAAPDGCTLQLEAGTYDLYTTLDPLGKAVVLRGAINPDGTPATTLRSDFSERVIRCTSGEGPNTILENLVLTAGGAPDGELGAGMLCRDSSPTIVNCSFETNQGGGIAIEDGDPTLIGCLFFKNTGTALTCTRSRTTIIDSTFYGNFDQGMLGIESDAILFGCTFSTNAAFIGGGLQNIDSDPILVDCLFEGNNGYTAGAGIHNTRSSPVLFGCTFEDNYGDFGCGLHNVEGSRPRLEDCVLTGNAADVDGGGVWSDTDSRAIILGSTLCDNTPNQVSGPWEDLGGNTIGTTCAPVCPADLDGDGQVTAADLSLLLGAWNTASTSADLNGDGSVDAADLAILLGAWGACA